MSEKATQSFAPEEKECALCSTFQLPQNKLKDALPVFPFTRLHQQCPPIRLDSSYEMDSGCAHSTSGYAPCKFLTDARFMGFAFNAVQGSREACGKRARAHRRVSWKHWHGEFTQARSRASPGVQSAHKAASAGLRGGWMWDRGQTHICQGVYSDTDNICDGTEIQTWAQRHNITIKRWKVCREVKRIQMRIKRTTKDNIENNHRVMADNQRRVGTTQCDWKIIRGTGTSGSSFLWEKLFCPPQCIVRNT